MACQSTGNGCAGTRRCRWQFPIHDLPDADEDPISVVAPASGRLCVGQRDGDGRSVVSDFPELVGESDCVEDRRRETLPTGSAVLSGINLGRLYTRMRVEPHRVGAGDADVYRVALMRKLLDTYTNLC